PSFGFQCHSYDACTREALSEVAVATGTTFTPLISSQSAIAVSPSVTSWSGLEMAEEEPGDNSSLMLRTSQAKQATINQVPRNRGRNPERMTSTPKGKSQTPQKISLITKP